VLGFRLLAIFLSQRAGPTAVAASFPAMAGLNNGRARTKNLVAVLHHIWQVRGGGSSAVGGSAIARFHAS
jgi:hypothetical protein